MEFDRRSVLKISVVSVWASPVIQSVLLPVHAQTSAAAASVEVTSSDAQVQPDTQEAPATEELPETSIPSEGDEEPPVKLVTPPAV